MMQFNLSVKSRIGRWLGSLLLLAGASILSEAALAVDCSDFPNGVIDGFAGDIAPSQIQIDTNCTIRNFPASNPLNTNFSFLTQPGQTTERWLIVFDNVVHTGEMACNSVAGHRIWFVNGSSSSIQEGCQNLLIPVEKIVKDNPPDTLTAAIGIPFTYTLTMPVLFDAGTQTVIDGLGSLNDLHGITLTDNLNETGADLTYISHTAYWKDSGAPATHTFSNADGLLTFSDFDVITSGDQVVIEITVVLEDTPVNAIGTQFINTAKWEFGRLIEGVFYEPLPGEWGISDPLVIAAPNLVAQKTGSTILNLGQTGEFTIDIVNVGLTDAWDVTLEDEFPNGPTGGMCDMTPQIQSARVFAGGGTTPVDGKGPLIEGTDYTFEYRDAPFCILTLSMHTPAASIGPGERLIIEYTTELDPDSDNGVPLTNVAGAVEWFNGNSSNADRVGTSRGLSDGTLTLADHEDAHTVVTALSGVFYEKTVENLTTGENPASTVTPGDELRYTLRIQTTESALNSFTFRDDLGELNATAVFEPGSFSLVAGSLPPGADTSNTNPNGGTNGAGFLEVGNLSLPIESELQVQFDITVGSSLLDGTLITNQADLVIGNVKVADSDDPTVNGQADPDVPGDEDPTQILVQRVPPPPVSKVNNQDTATIGQPFSYRITVPSTPHTATLYDVRILDDLAATGADLEFVDVTVVSGAVAWTPANTGTTSNIVIEDTTNGIDIPAGEQIVLEITVVLTDTATNVSGLEFANTAGWTYNQIDDDPASRSQGEPGSGEPMTIVEPDLTLVKTGPVQMRIGDPAMFTLDIHNIGESPAFGIELIDYLPNTAQGGTCDNGPAQITARLFEADGTTAASPLLTSGTDYTATFNGDPDCTLVIETLTTTAAIGPDQHLIVTYEAQLDADTELNATLTNIAGIIGWTNDDIGNDQARTYQRTVTDGTVDILDHEDAHTTVEFTPVLIFEKRVANVTTGEDPASIATPGDTLHYTLYIENASDTAVDDFTIIDELDALNTVPSFAPGTLTVTDIPNGADSSAADANGGADGTGLLEVSGLSIGGLGDSLTVEFEVELAPAIANESVVLNQSRIEYFGTRVGLSDDPNIGGDEDPTQIAISSSPVITLEKTSAYVDGDPSVLLAGETLRYTITAQNTGTDHATGVEIVDQIPASVLYVIGSTTLNGVPLADTGSTSPLVDGILLNAPEDTTPGQLNAAVADNVATVTFDVTVVSDVPDGTVISNQAFLSASPHGIADQPSDDPRTALVNDPTRDIVGNLPLLFAEKTATLQVDAGSPGIVDPGDVLRYTIAVHNTGNSPATGVELQDDVPANTTYVTDSTTLNGAPAGQPDNGAFPLAGGISVNSAGAGAGILSPGESAVVQFDLRVDDATASGTLITNQAVVSTGELSDLLTDGDGDPATGPEPTIVVVGDTQQLSIENNVTVVGGGAAIAGATLEYIVTVTNVGSVPATAVTVTDSIDDPGLTYVDPSATMNGLTDGVSFDGTTLTADYSSINGALPPGEKIVLRFRGVLDDSLTDGTTVNNTALVQWNDPAQSASDTATLDIGGIPGLGILGGTIWHDIDFSRIADTGEPLLQGWTVTLHRNDQVITSTLSDVDGAWVVPSVAPNDANTDEYSVVFTAPGAGIRTASLGTADSPFTNGTQRIDDIVVQSGSNQRNLNLPVQPNGVVYDAFSRQPVAGATVTLVDAASLSPLPESCFDDSLQQNQVTPVDGYYKFDLNFSDAACTGGAGYLIEVDAPGSLYLAGPSELIPPTTDSSTSPFDVPSCPGSANDAIPATSQHCESQPSAFAPDGSVPARSPETTYYLHLTLDSTAPPGTSQIFNNHIPLEPDLTGVLSITKTTPSLNVTRGEMVPYTISVNNSFGMDLLNVAIVDRFPAGFHYVEGSARLDGVPTEPVIAGGELTWSNLRLSASGEHQLRLLLGVGGGVSEGEFTNRALVVNPVTGAPMSEEATATVRLIPDPTFDCTDVTGKVFDDANRNGYQDDGETGIAGVRVVTTRGLTATTDAHGRYHFTCAIVPHADRGSNFVLKVDDRTLPSGFRLSSRPVAVQRATRGKTLRMNFGASIHRVVSLDIADAVFEPGTTDMRDLWRPRMVLLLEELQKAPSILRLSYLADIEEKALVERRLESMKKNIERQWEAMDGNYELIIEPEIFWRKGDR